MNGKDAKGRKPAIAARIVDKPPCSGLIPCKPGKTAEPVIAFSVAADGEYIGSAFKPFRYANLFDQLMFPVVEKNTLSRSRKQQVAVAVVKSSQAYIGCFRYGKTAFVPGYKPCIEQAEGSPFIH